MLNIKKFLRPTVLSGVTRVGLVRPFSMARPTLSQQEEDDESKQGFLKSVLYGKEQNGAVIPGDNTTHSKKLARGKYVHEMQSK